MTGSTKNTLGRCFGLPNASLSDEILAAIAVPHAMQLMERFADCHGRAVNDQSSGLLEYLHGCLPLSASFDDAWDVCLGLLEFSLDVDDKVCVQAAVDAGLHFARRGVPGRWHASLEKPLRLRLGATSFEAVEIEVEVERAGYAILFQDQRGDQGRITSDSKPTDLVGADVLLMPSILESPSIALLDQRTFGDTPGYDRLFVDIGPVSAVDDGRARSVADALDTLGNYSDEYFRWVRRVVHDLVVTYQVDGTRLVSGSSQMAPGVVHLSSPLGAMELAEILIHEAAHQYFYLLEWVGPLDTGDGKRYWSPPIRSYRPISRVLMAMHALVNVNRFYDMVGQAPLSDADAEYVRTFQPGVVADIEVLDRGIRDSDALSETGWGLYGELKREVDLAASS